MSRRFIDLIEKFYYYCSATMHVISSIV